MHGPFLYVPSTCTCTRRVGESKTSKVLSLEAAPVLMHDAVARELLRHRAADGN